VLVVVVPSAGVAVGFRDERAVAASPMVCTCAVVVIVSRAL
jgi:hypothetical protein